MSHFLISYAVFEFFDRAFTARNVNKYSKSPLKEEFAAAAANVKAEINNPNYTMIGENIEILRNAFTASKEAGKTWQIWAGATSTNLKPFACLLHVRY